MKSYVRAILFTALSLMPFHTFAQVPEFLTPVTGSEEATVRAQNEYFLKKHLYSAKRHRIVRVNTDLLESEEHFTISLFDDVSLTAAVTKLDVNPDRLFISWTGEIVDPPWSVESLMSDGQGRTRERAKFLHSSLFGLSIEASRVNYDEASGANFPSLAPGKFRSRGGRALSAASNESVFYGVSAQFFVLPSADEYKLEALEMGGAYHVVFEVEQSKIVTPGDFDDPNNPEMGERRRQYTEFMESLGEDPRRAIIREQQARFRGEQAQ